LARGASRLATDLSGFPLVRLFQTIYLKDYFSGDARVPYNRALFGMLSLSINFNNYSTKKQKTRCLRKITKY